MMRLTALLLLASWTMVSCSGGRVTSIHQERVMILPVPFSQLPTSYPFLSQAPPKVITGEHGEILVAAGGLRAIVRPMSSLSFNRAAVHLDEGSIDGWLASSSVRMGDATTVRGTGFVTLTSTGERSVVGVTTGTVSLSTISAIRKMTGASMPPHPLLPGVAVAGGRTILPESVRIVSTRTSPMAMELSITGTYRLPSDGTLVFSEPIEALSGIAVTGVRIGGREVTVTWRDSVTGEVPLAKGEATVEISVLVLMPYMRGGYMLDVPVTPAASVSSRLDIARMGAQTILTPMKVQRRGTLLTAGAFASLTILFARQNMVKGPYLGAVAEPKRNRRRVLVAINPSSASKEVARTIEKMVWRGVNAFETFEARGPKGTAGLASIAAVLMRPRHTAVPLSRLLGDVPKDGVVIYIGPAAPFGSADFNALARLDVPVLMLMTEPAPIPLTLPPNVTALDARAVDSARISFLLERIRTSPQGDVHTGVVQGGWAFSISRPPRRIAHHVHKTQAGCVPRGRAAEKIPPSQNINEVIERTVEAWHSSHDPSLALRAISLLLRVGKRQQAAREGETLLSVCASWEEKVRAGSLLHEYGFETLGLRLIMAPYLEREDARTATLTSLGLWRIGRTEEARLLLTHALQYHHDENAGARLALLVWRRDGHVPPSLASHLPQPIRWALTGKGSAPARDALVVFDPPLSETPFLSLDAQANRRDYPSLGVTMFWGTWPDTVRLYVRWPAHDSRKRTFLAIRRGRKRTARPSISVPPGAGGEAVIRITAAGIGVE